MEPPVEEKCPHRQVRISRIEVNAIREYVVPNHLRLYLGQGYEDGLLESLKIAGRLSRQAIVAKHFGVVILPQHSVGFKKEEASYGAGHDSVDPSQFHVVASLLPDEDAPLGED
jgi:hypothetical protein